MTQKGEITVYAYLRGVARGLSEAGALFPSLSESRRERVLWDYITYARREIPADWEGGYRAHDAAPTLIDTDVKVEGTPYTIPAGWYVTNGRYALRLDAAIPDEDVGIPVAASSLVTVMRESAKDEPASEDDSDLLFLNKRYAKIIAAFPTVPLLQWNKSRDIASSGYLLLDPNDRTKVIGVLLGYKKSRDPDSSYYIGKPDPTSVPYAAISYDPKQKDLRAAQGRAAAQGRRAAKAEAVRERAGTGAQDAIMDVLLTAPRDRIGEDHLLPGVVMPGESTAHDWITNGGVAFRVDWLKQQKVRLIGNFSRTSFSVGEKRAQITEALQDIAERTRAQTDRRFYSVRYADALSKAVMRKESVSGALLLYDANADLVGLVMPLQWRHDATLLVCDADGTFLCVQGRGENAPVEVAGCDLGALALRWVAELRERNKKPAGRRGDGPT